MTDETKRPNLNVVEGAFKKVDSNDDNDLSVFLDEITKQVKNGDILEYCIVVRYIDDSCGHFSIGEMGAPDNVLGRLHRMTAEYERSSSDFDEDDIEYPE